MRLNPLILTRTLRVGRYHLEWETVKVASGIGSTLLLWLLTAGGTMKTTGRKNGDIGTAWTQSMKLHELAICGAVATLSQLDVEAEFITITCVGLTGGVGAQVRHTT